MRRFLSDHSLSLFFLAIFLASLVGQAIAGHILHNEEALAHQGEEMSFWRYLVSSDFGNSVMENWQSEYLQFMLFMLATIWLVERGSPESKEPGKQGLESRPITARRPSPGWSYILAHFEPFFTPRGGIAASFRLSPPGYPTVSSQTGLRPGADRVLRVAQQLGSGGLLTRRDRRRDPDRRGSRCIAGIDALTFRAG